MLEIYENKKIVFIDTTFEKYLNDYVKKYINFKLRNCTLNMDINNFKKEIVVNEILEKMDEMLSIDLKKIISYKIKSKIDIVEKNTHLPSSSSVNKNISDKSTSTTIEPIKMISSTIELNKPKNLSLLEQSSLGKSCLNKNAPEFSIPLPTVNSLSNSPSKESSFAFSPSKEFGLNKNAPEFFIPLPTNNSNSLPTANSNSIPSPSTYNISNSLSTDNSNSISQPAADNISLNKLKESSCLRIDASEFSIQSYLDEIVLEQLKDNNDSKTTEHVVHTSVDANDATDVNTSTEHLTEQVVDANDATDVNTSTEHLTEQVVDANDATDVNTSTDQLIEQINIPNEVEIIDQSEEINFKEYEKFIENFNTKPTPTTKKKSYKDCLITYK
jgi:hypothetical protein